MNSFAALLPVPSESRTMFFAMRSSNERRKVQWFRRLLATLTRPDRADNANRIEPYADPICVPIARRRNDRNGGVVAVDIGRSWLQDERRLIVCSFYLQGRGSKQV